jgi:hypothetical protein
MRRSVSKSVWEGAKRPHNLPEWLENAFHGTTHLQVGVFLTSI